MAQIDPEKFDEFLKLTEEIKNQIVTDKKSAQKKEKSQFITQIATVAIALISLFVSFWTVSFNNKNFRYQQEVQTYTLWVGYLQTAAQNPQMANGLSKIDSIPVASLACRAKYKKNFPQKTVDSFEHYAWFVANALGHAEIVGDLADKVDSGWTATIETLISNHLDYISCDCFPREHYGDFINKEIDHVIESKKHGK